MKLDCVLTAVNENPLYLDFIPFFIQAWNKLYPGVDIKIILIGNSIPRRFLQYQSNIILFKPIPGVLTSFTSQFIRLLYPCILNYENGVLITDIDMIPMNRTYYTKNIEPYDNSKFIYFGANNILNEITICYNVATPNTWKQVFKIQSTADIANLLKLIAAHNEIVEGHGNKGWSIDQNFLTQEINKWNAKTNNFVALKTFNTGYNRLDRGFNATTSNLDIEVDIENEKYTDYHCYRPMLKYYELNYKILNLL